MHETLRRRVVAWSIAAVMVAANRPWCPPAFAADPINSRDRTSSSAKAGDHPDTQVNFAPAVGGTTDIGVGVGGFAAITRVRKGYDPFVWNLESAGLVTFKAGRSGGVDLPYQDVYVKLTVVRVFESASEIAIRSSYTSESTLLYDGLGNASSDATPPGAPPSYAWYARTHPALSAELRLRIVDHLAAHLEARYTQNWLRVDPDSRLAADLAGGSPSVKKLLGSTADHGVGLFAYGLQWDDRDDEVSPHAGSLHEAVVRVSPGGAGLLPYRYGQANVDERQFVPLWRKRLVLAVRAAADGLFGDPPFYELARFDDAYAIGGPKGVRGVPAQRYYGKIKVFGNAELRGELASFHALGKEISLGGVAFFDAGRVWADWTAHPELDGSELGLKYGTGVGLRLRSGRAFLLRADIAWSPDARPLGGYVDAGQVF